MLHGKRPDAKAGSGALVLSHGSNAGGASSASDTDTATEATEATDATDATDSDTETNDGTATDRGLFGEHRNRRLMKLDAMGLIAKAQAEQVTGHHWSLAYLHPLLTAHC